MGILLRNCAEVRTAIELLFGVVSGVGQGIDVLDEVHVTQGKGAVSDFSAFAPCSHRNVFDLCVKS